MTTGRINQIAATTEPLWTRAHAGVRRLCCAARPDRSSSIRARHQSFASRETAPFDRGGSPASCAFFFSFLSRRSWTLRETTTRSALCTFFRLPTRWSSGDRGLCETCRAPYWGNALLRETLDRRPLASDTLRGRRFLSADPRTTRSQCREA